MTKEKSLQELFAASWGFVPELFADGSDFVHTDQLSPINPKERGCPGPRARLPIPAIPNDFDYKEIAEIVQEVIEKKLTKIIITYPTSYGYLDSASELPSDKDALHWRELKRIHSDLSLMAKALIKEAEDNKITVEFLPMAKLTNRRATDHRFGGITPIRFWTATQPPQDAAYVVFDDVISRGSTCAGMLSLLTHHGVPKENLIGSITGMKIYPEPFTLHKTQIKAIDTFYQKYPDTAKRADVILGLIGIDGLKALTRSEFARHFSDIRNGISPSDMDSMSKSIYQNRRDYESIPEPTQSYVKRLAEVGLPTTPPRI